MESKKIKPKNPKTKPEILKEEYSPIKSGMKREKSFERALEKCSHVDVGMCFLCLSKSKGPTKIVESKKIKFGKRISLEGVPQKTKPEIMKEEYSPIKIKENSFKCPECPRTFGSKSGIKTHGDLVHRGVRYACDFCNKIFPKNKDLQNHVKVIHLGNQFNCHICNKKLLTQSSLDFHIKNIHEKIRFDCDECGKTFCSKNILKQHYEGIHKGVRYLCPECDYKATDPSNLNVHLHRMHPGLKETRRKPYVYKRVSDQTSNSSQSPKIKIE